MTMRASVLAVLAATLASACAIAACSSSDSPSGASSGGATADGSVEGGPTTAPDGAVNAGDAGTDAAKDAARQDGDTETDGAIPDDGGPINPGDPPAVLKLGRFENDGVGDNLAFPGSKLIARFNGTDAAVKLSQTDGFSGGPTWFNVVVDGVLQTKLEVTGAGNTYAVATNLAAGAHVVELEKRTEPNLGIIRYEGFTFPNGGALLAPPARPTRRIEFLSDSTIDGFGVEGNYIMEAAGNYCGPSTAANYYGAPPRFNNARKSAATVASTTLLAENHLIAYSGKGLTKNGDPGDPLLFPELYDRALPDSMASAYGFAWKPDAVVISLGGVDFDGLVAAPAGFVTNYGVLVDKIRSHYPNAWIFMTVWSQIKDDNILTRTAMKNALQDVINARAADTKLARFEFPEASSGADESGCQQHGNEAHHAAMGALLATQIKTTLGW